MKTYKATLTKEELTDALTDLIDRGIRKGQYATYEEWLEAVSKLLESLEAAE